MAANRLTARLGGQGAAVTAWEDRATELAGLIYPPPKPYEEGLEYPLAAVRAGKRGAFLLGADWQRGQLHAEVSLARAIAAMHRPADGGTLCVECEQLHPCRTAARVEAVTE